MKEFYVRLRIARASPDQSQKNIFQTIPDPVDQWSKTQPDGGMKGLLDCGTRSFDWRPKLKDGKLIMHHGTTDVEHAMSDSLDELLSWLDSRDETAENLVHMSIAECEGDGCEDAVNELLASKNISKIVQDCADIDGKTVGDIMSMSTLQGEQRGHLFVASGCLDMNYNESITCAGFHTSKRHLRGSNNIMSNATNLDLSLTYTCYSDSSTKDFPLNRMWDYVHSVVDNEPQFGRLYSVQVLWEETATSIAIGEAHLSSLLDTEKRSQLNNLLTQKIKSGEIDSSKLNLVEVNNVCDGGNDLQNALYAARGWS